MIVVRAEQACSETCGHSVTGLSEQSRERPGVKQEESTL